MKHSLLTILFLLVAASGLQAQAPHPARIYLSGTGIDDTRTGERLFFAADTRGLSYIVPRLAYIAVECNYEESLLAASQRIPESLKNRIRHSHFEVEDVIRWLKKQDLSHVMTIYLLHLSAGNSRAAEWQQMFAREFPGIEIQICAE